MLVNGTKLSTEIFPYATGGHIPLGDGFFWKRTELYDIFKSESPNIRHEPRVYCRHNKRITGRGCSICIHCTPIYKSTIAPKERARDLWLVTKREFFIKRANEVHNSYYDYSQVVYVGSKTPVVIGCPRHGRFEQCPNNHLGGEGCRDCFREDRQGKFRLQTRDQILERFKSVHGDAYDYSLFVFVNSMTPSTIICRACGEHFRMTSEHHILNRQGCKICVRKKQGELCRTPPEEYFEACTIIHEGQYDYTDSIYATSHDKITFRCRECNQPCTMKAYAHKQGHGCTCTKNITEKRILAPFLTREFNSGSIEIEHMGNRISDGVGRMDFRIKRNGVTIGYIECDGRHHGIFRSARDSATSYFNRIGSPVNAVQERDLDKYVRSRERGCPVIRIEQQYIWQDRQVTEPVWKPRLINSIKRLLGGEPLALEDAFICGEKNVYSLHPCYWHEVYRKCVKEVKE